MRVDGRFTFGLKQPLVLFSIHDTKQEAELRAMKIDVACKPIVRERRPNVWAVYIQP